MQSSSSITPVPWQLTGDGLVWLYSFPKEFIFRYGFLEQYHTSSYWGGIGAVMLMDYKTSGVGPYQELLFIPAVFKMKGKLSFSVSKIYVSTQESALSGRQNWGIPKELADFSFMVKQDGTKHIRVRNAGTAFFQADVKQKGISFPFATHILPLTSIVQRQHDRFLLTRPEASGWAKLATTLSIKADEMLFPPVQHLKPWITLSLDQFKMEFPIAELLQ